MTSKRAVSADFTEEEITQLEALAKHYNRSLRSQIAYSAVADARAFANGDGMFSMRELEFMKIFAEVNAKRLLAEMRRIKDNESADDNQPSE